jgi:hypothetical protein
VSGFVVIQREALDHHVIGNPRDFYAWCWLISTACWKPTKFSAAGKTITLQRGQLCASVRQLAAAWGMSKSAADRFLARLETETMIEREAGHGRLVLTIRNYDKYQDKPEGQRDRSGTLSGTAAGQQRDTKEQGNKGTIDSPNGESPPHTPPPKRDRSTSRAKFAMPLDWQPGPLPADVAELVAQWPPGRFEREVADVRAYWIEDGTKRPGWDRTLHSRIRNIHDRVLRESRNDRQRSPASTGGIAAALDRRIGIGEPAGSPGRSDAGSGGDYRALPAPKVALLR